jgi:hypothetical protein
MNLTRWRNRAKRTVGACFEVARDGAGNIVVRERKAGRNGQVLVFTPEEWHTLLSNVQVSEFDAADRQKASASPAGSLAAEIFRKATMDAASQKLTLTALGFIRNAGLAFAGVFIGGAILVGAAIGAVASGMGAHPHIALCFGAAGGASVLVTTGFRAWRGIAALLRALSSALVQQGDSPSRPTPHSDHDRPAA